MKSLSLNEKNIEETAAVYAGIKRRIEMRLREFKKKWKNGNEEDLFAELVFCILTPQSNAHRCWEAVQNLREKNLIMNGTARRISGEINKARFKNKKAEYIVETRKRLMDNNSLVLKEKINAFDTIADTRIWLVNTVKGYGFKEASHFLRNIGFGEKLAILDRHILRNMVSTGLIESIPSSFTKNRYEEIENRLVQFAEGINIPVSHLDFVWWYKEAGEVFK